MSQELGLLVSDLMKSDGDFGAAHSDYEQARAAHNLAMAERTRAREARLGAIKGLESRLRQMKREP